MKGDVVEIKFSGPNASGKTLMMNIIKEKLEECGCSVAIGDERKGHKLEALVLDIDKLAEASRKTKKQENDDAKLAAI